MTLSVSLIKKVFSTIFSEHTISQKGNYLKYILSNKQEVLGYGPVAISIVATGRCTLSCDMCPTHSSRVNKDYAYAQKNVNDMDFEMFKHMIDRFDKAIAVQIIGSGEPLLNKDFFKMVNYAAGKKMKVKTFSNGTTIEENLDSIINSGLDGITISINGHSAEEFKRMTGMDKEIYAKIYNAVKKLVTERNRRGADIKVKVSFIVDKYNYKSIPDMIKTAAALGVDHAFFCNFLPSPFEGLNARERVLTADDKTLAELKNIFKSCPADFCTKVTPPVLVEGRMEKNKCDAHFSQIRFDGDGNVSSCSMMLLNMAGNGNYKDKDIWNNDFFRRMRCIFLSGDARLLPDPCRVCPDNKGIQYKI